MILLDTHILVRWLAGGQRLSKEQLRVLDAAERRGQSVSISAITLIELAQLRLSEVLHTLETNPAFTILPLTIPIAREVAILRPVLRDPADAVIAATARVHGLRLVTSDQRIIEANVVSTIA